MNKIARINIYIAIFFSIVLFIACDANSSENNEITSKSNNILANSAELKQSNIDKTNIFSIRGRGSVKQKQEILEINLAIENRDKEIIKATNSVNENIEKILEIAKLLGIDEDQIVTKEYSISPVTRWVEKKDDYGEYGESQIIAYRVYNSVLITSEDKDSLTSFIDKANAEVGNSFRVNNIKFKAKANEQNKILSREKAVEDALKKAKFYEDKLNIELGKIIYFDEFQHGGSNHNLQDPVPMMRMAEASMPSTDLFAGESEIISEVFLGFEIK
tara:strand:- start:3874 stop:4695 length:822 start_codon:yes stop_codon:yes gene_type:complete